MPAKNIYHDCVVQALTADGWVVTHDPLTLAYGGKDLFVDLGQKEHQSLPRGMDNESQSRSRAS